MWLTEGDIVAHFRRYGMTEGVAVAHYSGEDVVAHCNGLE